MSQLICSAQGRKLTDAELSRAMLTSNLAGGFACVCTVLTYAGYATITVFLSEWLLAPASVIGFIVMLASILPVMQPLVAQIVQRVRHRKRFTLWVFSISFASIFAIAIVPFFGRSADALQFGLVITTVVVIIYAFGCQITTLSMWTWLGDIVPEHKRSWFFGQGASIANVMGTLGFFVSCYVIDHFGGTKNQYIMSGTFAFAGIMGFVAVYLYSRVPDVPAAAVPANSFKEVVGTLIEPIRDRKFLMVLVFLAAVSFSNNLISPFAILYARATAVGGHNPGFSMSLQYWATISTVGGLMAIVAGPFWGWIGDRLGNRFIMACGCLGLLWFWVFFISTPGSYHIQMLFGMCMFGFLFPAYNIGWGSCGFNLSTSRNRAAYMATIPLAMMTGGAGAMLGGYLSDKFPIMNYTLPSGIPFAYIHLLTIISTVVLLAAICIVLLIQLPNQRKLSEVVLIVMDFQFLPNIIRAQLLAHTSNPSLIKAALKGIRGKSSVIIFKEVKDKTVDANRGVRHAAISAMGRIDSIEARDLYMILTESGSDLKPEVLAVTSACPETQTTNYLERGLHSSEPAYRITAALACAGNYDPKLENLLETVLQFETNDSVRSAIISVLCTRGGKKLPNVLDAFGQVTSESIRNEIAVSLANALAEKDEFYRILSHETVMRGSCFPKLLRRIRHFAKSLPHLREKIIKTLTSLEESFHAGKYDEVLSACNSLIKESIANGDAANLCGEVVVLDKLYVMAQLKADKSQANLEMLLGVYLTKSKIQRILKNKQKQSGDDGQLVSQGIIIANENVNSQMKNEVVEISSSK